MALRTPDDLRHDIERWVAAGLLSHEQGAAIVAHESSVRPPEPPEGGISVLAEALGYAGSALALAGIAVALGQSWKSMSSAMRVASAVIPTILVFGAGWVLRAKREPALRRLMSLLWALAVGGVVGTTGVIIAEFASDIDEEWVPVVLGVAMLVPAVILWRILPAVLQQMAVLGGVLLTALGIVAALPGEPNGTAMALTAWGVGAIWLVLGWRGRLAPAAAAMVFGAVVAAYCPVLAADRYQWLLALGIVTGAALMLLSVRTGAVALLAIGTVTVFGYVTGLVLRYFRDQLGVPLALIIIGGTFIGLALLAARLGRLSRRGIAS